MNAYDLNANDSIWPEDLSVNCHTQKGSEEEHIYKVKVVMKRNSILNRIHKKEW